MVKSGQIVTTGDGSHTLYVPRLNEHYHSTFGAIRESRHIFIEAGLKQIFPFHNPVKILEIGFGTGLNALLSLIEAEKSGKTIHYTTIEPFPLNTEITSKLNYPALIGIETEPLFNRLHEVDWNRKIQITEHFILHKILNSLEKTDLEDNCFELVFFDAFGPEVQPDLWTEKIFREILLSLIKGGILVTYSVKGSVRRALKTSGFSVEKIPGPAGKREITRAIKNGDKQV
jgi:tRNA U34 5-methylaminomethyl-2-thiouridine-forming methyltransferase MnmC